MSAASRYFARQSVPYLHSDHASDAGPSQRGVFAHEARCVLVVAGGHDQQQVREPRTPLPVTVVGVACGYGSNLCLPSKLDTTGDIIPRQSTSKSHTP